MTGDYQLVPLANGEQTLYSASYGEKMHPGLGPAAEADLLYVRQLSIAARLQSHRGEFIIWDVGLGAAANAIAALRAVAGISGQLKIISFDNTREPLEFALAHAHALGYVVSYAGPLARLLEDRVVDFQNGALKVRWEFRLGDFSMELEGMSLMEAPHAIFYDAFSPAKNPAMWTRPLFERLYAALDPGRPCALTTYSRSTQIRASLLLAGFKVGAGHATGMKEETTIAANDMGLIAEPLGKRWLERALRSDSAEPLERPVYTRSRLSTATAEKLRQHPQFA